MCYYLIGRTTYRGDHGKQHTFDINNLKNRNIMKLQMILPIVMAVILTSCSEKYEETDGAILRNVVAKLQMEKKLLETINTAPNKHYNAHGTPQVFSSVMSQHMAIDDRLPFPSEIEEVRAEISGYEEVEIGTIRITNLITDFKISPVSVLKNIKRIEFKQLYESNTSNIGISIKGTNDGKFYYTIISY